MAEPPETEHMPEIQSPRKLLAKINLNTKSKVRTVSISTDGRILAAATSSEIKIFQLQRRIDNETLRIKKIHLPKTLATSGARLVQFSPDGKWLTAITLDSEVCIARVSPNPDRPKALQVLPKVVELERRHRTPERSPFKDYDRSITRAAFAADSSVFVVSDLAGYLDSWVLEGHEDVTAPAVDLPQDNFQADSSDAGSDAAESSSDDSDDEGTAVFYGQHWTDNPSGHLLPRLEAPALVLSFRPPGNQQASSQPLVNGNPGVHPTRSNPHARSHELPPGQHRLLVVTAKHQIHEFDILAGRLSEWSRRSSGLPEDFLKIRDRVMGAIWDIYQRRERLWLWGISFVCMMDVGEEQVANSETSQALTRKRRKPKGTTDEGEGEGRKRRKIGSGAGSRTDKAQGGIMKEDLTDGVLEDGDESDDEQGILTNDEHSENKRFWTTFKYRPILGVVPLGDADKGPLEVAIVERPLWDARDKST
jgi:U3 small nucleolar RNA-associated protein 4